MKKTSYLKVKDYSVSGESFELIYNETFDFLETQPLPLLNKLPDYYKSEDYISHTDSQRTLFEKAYQFVKKITLTRKLKIIKSNAKEGKRLLDFGCGTGDFLKEAQKKIKARLADVYKELLGANPSTFLQVSIGKIRNISINIVGEVNVPGTYTINALSTVFNALYAAGGPTFMGTLRDIKVYRQSKQIATVDIYDFLLNGNTNSNVHLQHNDVIISLRSPNN